MSEWWLVRCHIVQLFLQAFKGVWPACDSSYFSVTITSHTDEKQQPYIDVPEYKLYKHGQSFLFQSL